MPSARARGWLSAGPLTALPRFDDARVVLALDADPLGFGPEQIRFGARHRRLRGDRARRTDSLRLYAVEPDWTLTGALADHRIALPPELIRNVAIESRARARRARSVRRRCRPRPSNLRKPWPPISRPGRGAALVIAGPRQPAEVHALCHWIKAQLGRRSISSLPSIQSPTGTRKSLRNLAADFTRPR